MFLRRVTKGRRKHMNVSEKGYQRKLMFLRRVTKERRNHIVSEKGYQRKKEAH
jgi:hypothetical protein